jgi:hypothetical protein
MEHIDYTNIIERQEEDSSDIKDMKDYIWHALKASMLKNFFNSWLVEHIGNCTNKMKRKKFHAKGFEGFHIHKLNV